LIHAAGDDSGWPLAASGKNPSSAHSKDSRMIGNMGMDFLLQWLGRIATENQTVAE
jgi:hypothetical protein